MTAVNDTPDGPEIFAHAIRSMEAEWGIPEGVDLIGLRFSINEAEELAHRFGVDFVEWLDERSEALADPTGHRMPNPLTEGDFHRAEAEALSTLNAVMANAQDVPDGVKRLIHGAIGQVIAAFSTSLGVAAN